MDNEVHEGRYGGGYPALLERLRDSRSELEQVPSWYRGQLITLAVSVPVIAAVMAGLFPVFVPPYLLLPFVLIPTWKLIHGERERRAKLRAVVAQMRIAEERLGALEAGTQGRNDPELER